MFCIINCRYGKMGDHHTTDAGIKHGEGAWRAYQVNLVVGGATPVRVNLLDSGGRTQLETIAREIAEFLGVPFYVGSQAA